MAFLKMRKEFITIGSLALIAIATAWFMLNTQEAYEDAIDCMTADTRWDYGDIHWSADGERVVIFAYERRLDGFTPRTFVIPVAGEGLETLAEVDVDRAVEAYDLVYHPSRGWNADRTMLAVGQEDETGRQIYVVDAATGEQRRLTDERFPAGKPQWSPDGTMIAYAVDRSGMEAGSGDFSTVWAVMVIDAEGGNARLLTVLEDEPDIGWLGDEVLYSTVQGTFRIDLESTESERVVAGRYPVISPDGERMVYLSSAACEPDVLIREDGESRVIYTFDEDEQ